MSRAGHGDPHGRGIEERAPVYPAPQEQYRLCHPPASAANGYGITLVHIRSTLSGMPVNGLPG